MPSSLLWITGEVLMPSLPGPQRALLVPSPPKCASQTLAALLSDHLDAPVVRHKTSKGFGHLLLNVPQLSQPERWMRAIGFQQQQNRPLIYGHYPASHHNLKQLKRRYSTAAVVIPVRPLGALLCSLIHHTRRKSYGPLDLRCPGMIDGIPDLHERSESDLFHLLGILYLPQIYLLIRSWVETTKANNIQLIFAPFKSITEAQSDLLKKMNELLPKDFRSTSPTHKNSSEVKVNMSTTRRIKPTDIGAAERTSVNAIATKLLSGDDSLGPLLPYLLSDLSSPEEDSAAPLLWNFNRQQ